MKTFKKFLIATSLFISIIGFNSIYGQVADIPFEFKGKQIFIKMQTGQSDSLRFIFDTGSTGALIDSATAEKAGVSKDSRIPANVAGSGGSRTYTMALNQSLNLKGVEFKHINLTLIDFTSLSAQIGVKLDGIIGFEILNRYVTQLNFDEKKLKLYDQIQSVDTTGYMGIPFEFSKSTLIPRFPISITLANGESFTGKVMFDTGNAFALIVSTPFSKYHNFDVKLGEKSITGGRGVNSVTQDQLADIRSMSFNGFKFGPMGIRLTINPEAEAKDGYLGNIGIEIIKRFNVILDYAHKKIYLKPNRSYNEVFHQESTKRKLIAQNKLFLDKNKSKPGVKVTASGLQYKIIRKGKGVKPRFPDKVALHFTTTLINGKKLWSTYENNTPWTHHLDKALMGVQEAALLMPEGSKWVLYIPSSLAFGDEGDEEVPAGATLIYELELVSVEKK